MGDVPKGIICFRYYVLGIGWGTEVKNGVNFVYLQNRKCADFQSLFVPRTGWAIISQDVRF